MGKIIVSVIHLPETVMPDRISDLQERLDRQYLLLKEKEFALYTEPAGTKGEPVLRNSEIEAGDWGG